MSDLFSFALSADADMIAARTAARRAALFLGLDTQDAVRVATATSEIARDALRHRGGGRCRARLVVDGTPMLVVEILSREGGAPDGAASRSARRLLDGLASAPAADGGTLTTLHKVLPPDRALPDGAALARFAAAQRPAAPLDLVGELQEQNRDLLLALDEVKRQREELAQLNEELQDTNRGVVALYAELDERAEALRRADAMKTRFLSDMSHEFRTPLNSMLALSRLLLARTDGDLTGEQEKQVALIRDSAVTLTDIVNDLLDIAQVESGKAVLRPQTFTVAGLFGALRGMLRPLLASDGVALVFEEPVDLPVLHTDEGKVAQILRNFISNALKFTEAGEVRVSARVTDDGHVVFAVADTGIGIAPEHHGTIFEEFTQIENPIQGRVRGTGLGLPLSRQLAQLLGGDVALTSIPGTGSTFELLLPVHIGLSAAEAPASDADAAALLPTAVAAVTGSATLLVVDDDPAARYLVRHCAAEHAVSVVEAVDGPTGLHDALAMQPNVIVLDVNMPGLDGVSVFEALAAHSTTRDVPTMIVTAAELDAAQRERLAGATAILSKANLDRQTLGAFLDQAGIARKDRGTS